MSRVQEAIMCPRCRLVFNVLPQGDHLLLKVTRKGLGRPEPRRIQLDVTGLVRKGHVIRNKQA
ncbi:MAG: hypothetical protein QMC81_05135 [Thermoanaerobacterales bacterium]|nr:hypothetical protein [Thermoanaerobacterales bacterium]